MFRASDNLESPIARASLRSLYGDIVRGEAEAITLETFCDWTGLTLVSKEGQMLEELPPIQRFLNRVLALPIAMQNAVFSALMEKIDLATARARDAGRLDVGLETLRGDRITAGAPQELRRCEITGAITSLVPIRVEQRRSYPSAAAVLEQHPSLTPMQNAASEAVALISPRPRQVFEDDGGVGFERRLIRPTGSGFMIEAQFARSNWENVDCATFATLWDEQVADLPDMEVRELHLLTGLILPIWKQIPGQNTRIYRVQPESGPALLGRALDAEQAATLRGRFMDLNAATPTEMLAVVMSTDRAVELGMGLSLKQRRVAGQKRLELTGAGTAEMAWLKSLGCFTEIHQYQLRLFVPTDDPVGPLSTSRAWNALPVRRGFRESPAEAVDDPVSDEAIALRIVTEIAAAGSSVGSSAVSVASVASVAAE